MVSLRYWLLPSNDIIVFLLNGLSALQTTERAARMGEVGASVYTVKNALPQVK